MRLRSFDLQEQDQGIAAFGSSYGDLCISHGVDVGFTDRTVGAAECNEAAIF
jgi:hypothetical protein